MRAVERDGGSDRFAARRRDGEPGAAVERGAVEREAGAFHAGGEHADDEVGRVIILAFRGVASRGTPAREKRDATR